MAQRIHGNDSPDGADAVRRVANFLVRVQDEVCRVKDFPTLFSERAHFVCVPRHFEAVSHGECKLQLVNGFFGLVEGIDGESHDIDTFFSELFDVCLVVG